MSPVPTLNSIGNEPIPATLIDRPPAQIVFEVRMFDVKVLFEREVKEFVFESGVFNQSGFTRQLNTTEVRQVLTIINDPRHATA